MVQLKVHSKTIALLFFYSYLCLLPLDFVFTIKLNMPMSPSVLIGLLGVTVLFLKELKIPIRWEFLVFLMYLAFLVVHPGSHSVSGFGGLVGIATSIYLLMGAYLLTRRKYIYDSEVFLGLTMFAISTLAYALYFYFIERHIMLATISTNLPNVRLSAGDFDENNFASILAMGGLVFLTRTYLASGILTFLYSICFGFLFFVMMLTGSRGAIIALVASSILLTFVLFKSRNVSGKKKFFIFIVFIGALFLTSFLFLSNELIVERFTQTIETGNLSAREIIWAHTIELIFEKYLYGFGFGGGTLAIAESMGNYGGVKGTHNTVLTIMLSAGIFLGSLVTFAYLNIPLWLKYARSYRVQVMTIHVLMALLALVLLTSMSIDWLNRKYYWIFMGLVLGLMVNRKDNKLVSKVR